MLGRRSSVKRRSRRIEDGKPRLMLACSLGRLSPVLLGWLHVTSWLVRLGAVNLTSGIVIRYHIMDKAGIPNDSWSTGDQMMWLSGGDKFIPLVCIRCNPS